MKLYDVVSKVKEMIYLASDIENNRFTCKASAKNIISKSNVDVGISLWDENTCSPGIKQNLNNSTYGFPVEVVNLFNHKESEKHLQFESAVMKDLPLINNSGTLDPYKMIFVNKENLYPFMMFEETLYKQQKYIKTMGSYPFSKKERNRLTLDSLNRNKDNLLFDVNINKIESYDGSCSAADNGSFQYNEYHSNNLIQCNEKPKELRKNYEDILNKTFQSSLKLEGRHKFNAAVADSKNTNSNINATFIPKSIISVPENETRLYRNIDHHSVNKYIYQICNCVYKKLIKYANRELFKDYMSSVRLRHISTIYKSLRVYKETYSSLLYIETVESISQSCAKIKPTWNKCQLFNGPWPRRFRKPIVPRNFHKVDFTYKLKLKCFNAEETPINGSIICIKYNGQYDLGYVLAMASKNPELNLDEDYKGDPKERISTLMLTVITTRSIFHFARNCCPEISIRFIARLNTVIKMYKSLYSLEDSPFHNFLLNPNISSIRAPLFNNKLLPNVNLNKEQTEAVLTISEEFVRNPSSTMIRLIHGPPGTGKTTTIAALIGQIHLFEESLERNNCRPILVCTPSNAAADELLLRIVKLSDIQIKLKVVRLGIKKKIRKEVRSFCFLSKMSHEDKKKMSHNEKIDELNRYDVIVSTLCSSYNSLTEDIQFSGCIIDEAGQCHEPESLIPLLFNFKKLILIGDQNQLSATITCNRALNYGLKLSMFERFYKYAADSGNLSGIHQLKEQYRMHESIAAWPSKQFYSNSLRTPNEITASRSYNIKPYMVFDLMFSKEDKIELSTRNNVEAHFIKCLCDVLKPHLVGMTVGIITPYNGQRALLKSLLKYHTNIFVSTVDMFQGQEKDIIICSFVRSNDDGEIGFLKDACRLNVALTRAKRSCFIVGNLFTFCRSKNKIWKAFIENAEERSVIQSIHSNQHTIARNAHKLSRMLSKNIFIHK